MNKMIQYISTYHDEILNHTIKHISMSFTAVLLACLIAIPLSFLVVNHKRTSKVVINIANVIQTIPSLALFAVCLPFLGIGSKPAIFALFLYALLPIIKNTLIGIRSTSPDVIKAATGMGMTKFQVLMKVEIPLAIPAIMGGVRIAAVTSIGLATIATLIGAGGLGSIIYQGLSLADNGMIFTGALISASLALIVDFLLGKVEKKLTSKGVMLSRKKE